MKTCVVFLITILSAASIASGQCGEVLLSSQSQIDSFRCDEVLGNMIISDDNDGVDNIVSLLPLKDIGLRLVGHSLIIRDSHGLQDLEGLDSLKEIGVNFEIVSNNNLQQLLPLENGDLALKRVGFNLTITDCPRLKTINGLGGIDTLGSGINFCSLDSLESVSSFQNLTRLSKILFISNPLFSSSLRFRSLEEITDSLIITKNVLLVECCWVSELAGRAPEGNVLLSENGDGCSDIENIHGPPPVLVNCPNDQSLMNLEGLCHNEFTVLNPILEGGCNTTFELEIVNVLSDFFLELEVSGESTEIDSLPVGFYRLRWKAENSVGESSSCDIRVAVEDKQVPVFTNQIEDDTLEVSVSSCLASYSITFPEVEDNCTSLEQSLHILDSENMDTIFHTDAVSGVSYQVELETGTYLVAASVTDASNQFDVSQASILVSDIGSPTLTTCPDDVTIDLEEDCVAEMSYHVPSVTGTCADEVVIREIVSELGNIIDSGVISEDTNSTTAFREGITEVRFRVLNDDSATCSFFVTVYGGLEVEVILTSTNIGCENESGLVTANLDTSSLQFSWSGPDNFLSKQLSAEVANPGEYYFIVEDTMGCTKSFSVDVFQGGSEVEVNVVKGAINCDLGERKLKTAQALSDYEYFWTGPDSFASELPEPFIRIGGWYFLRAEGNFGCTGTDSIFIEHDIAYNYELEVNANSAIVLVQGGTPPFSFLWDGSLSGDTINGLDAGDHSLRIVDGLGCAKDVDFEILLSDVSEVIGSEVELSPNPFMGEVQLYTKQGIKYSVYSATGDRLMSSECAAGRSTNIGGLWKPGLYFIVTENGKIYKVVKI